ncbi:MAG: hypothetical protein AB7I04_07765 [Pseudomonadales bacterium]
MKSTALTKRLTFLLIPILSLCGFNASAESNEDVPQAVLESYLCTYVDGKDRGDLDAATDFYRKQAAKAGIGTPTAYLWTKFKGSADAQMIWHNVYENLAAFGSQMDAEAGSAEMAAVGERYDSVVSCTPLLANVMPVHQREAAVTGENRFVASYACRTTAAPNPADFADLNRHIDGALGAMGNAAPLVTYVVSPITADPTGPNAVYFNVFENVSHWAAFEQQLDGSESGQMLVRHFTSMLNCASNLWGSEQIIAAAAE